MGRKSKKREYMYKYRASYSSTDGITNSMDMSLSKLWEFEQALGGLVSCSPWGHKESDMTEQLN